MSGKRDFGEKMGDWFRHILSCCDREEDEEARPALQISGPTNFRREDISIPGLDAEQYACDSSQQNDPRKLTVSIRQRFIREKAISDAGRVWEHLQPLRSSPSGHFADPSDNNNNNTTALPTYEQFTTPRSAVPSPGHSSNTAAAAAAASSPLDRLKAHSRKITNSLTKPLGYQSVGSKDGSPYEMRALMDVSRVQVVSPGKLSGESYSFEGSEEDRDSGKVMMHA